MLSMGMITGNARNSSASILWARKYWISCIHHGMTGDRQHMLQNLATQQAAPHMHALTLTRTPFRTRMPLTFGFATAPLAANFACFFARLIFKSACCFFSPAGARGLFDGRLGGVCAMCAIAWLITGSPVAFCLLTLYLLQMGPLPGRLVVLF